MNVFEYILNHSKPGTLIDYFMLIVENGPMQLIRRIQESKHKYQYGLDKRRDELLLNIIFNNAKKELCEFFYGGGFLLSNLSLKDYFIDKNSKKKAKLTEEYLSSDVKINKYAFKYLYISIKEKDLKIFEWLQSNSFRYEYGVSVNSDIQLLDMIVTMKSLLYAPDFTENLFNFMIEDGFPLVKPLVREYIVVNKISKSNDIKINLFKTALELNDLELLEFLQSSTFRYNFSKDLLGAIILIHEYESKLTNEMKQFLAGDGFIFNDWSADYGSIYKNTEHCEYLSDGELLDDFNDYCDLED